MPGVYPQRTHLGYIRSVHAWGISAAYTPGVYPQGLHSWKLGIPRVVTMVECSRRIATVFRVVKAAGEKSGIG
ncbi:hypothetical protein chiPu_0025599, partial [Chiloscyllium punctatum]|nr:hypothetical protein [Chiloscyllium punctatum]